MQRLAIAHAIGGVAAALLWTFSPGLMVALWGLLLAALDSYAVGMRIDERDRWLKGGVVAGVISVVPLFFVMIAVGQTLADTTPSVPLDEAEILWALIILIALTLGMTGLIVGLGQVFGLKSQVRGAGWWVLAQAGSGFATGMLMVLAWRALLGGDGLRELSTGLGQPLGALGMVIGGAVGGLAGGALCGMCLEWLLGRRYE